MVNGAKGVLEIIDMTDVTCEGSQSLTAVSLDLKALAETDDQTFTYGDITFIAVDSSQGLVAVALQAGDYCKNGRVALLNTDGEFIALLAAGCQSDMLTFTPDGSKILVANEGEARNGYASGNVDLSTLGICPFLLPERSASSIIDPAGSASLITLYMENLKDSICENITFEAFESRRDELTDSGVILKKGIVTFERSRT